MKMQTYVTHERYIFWNIQESGKKSVELVEMLNDRVNQKKYGCGIRTGKCMSEKYYVYLDDGLYTGSRLRKDIKRCIEMIPEGSRIDVIYMIACQSEIWCNMNADAFC